MTRKEAIYELDHMKTWSKELSDEEIEAIVIAIKTLDHELCGDAISPQQRTGRWIKQNYGWNWQCSECGFVTPPSAKEIFTFCPNCGAKMEVEK